jgi:phosphatidylglycerol:prolipoprotein diacylglycerol transferase
MIPVLFYFSVDSFASAAVLYALALVLIGYAAYAGWRGAEGPVGKGGQPTPPSRQARRDRAGRYAAGAAALTAVGLYFALPPAYFPKGLGKGIPLHTYGLMLASGFALAIWLSATLAEREWGPVEGPKKRDQVYDLAFWVFLAGIGGSVVLFNIINWRSPGLGLVFYGGLIGATVAAYAFARAHGIPFLRLADLAIPTVSLGQCFGRLGCFSAGCCWGKVAPALYQLGVQFPGGGLVRTLLGGHGPSESLAFSSQVADHRWVVESTGQVFEQFVPGAVEMSRWVAEHGHTFPLYPTQLFESAGQLLIFLGLMAMRGARRFHGQIFGLWLMAYAILRSAVELFRGDLERGTLRGLVDSLGMAELSAKIPFAAWYNLSTSELISVAMFLIGASILWRNGKHLLGHAAR